MAIRRLLSPENSIAMPRFSALFDTPAPALTMGALARQDPITLTGSTFLITYKLYPLR